MVVKVSPCYIYNIYSSTRSKWLWALYFLNYFEWELFYRDGTFIKKDFLLRHEKNGIYSKLLSNPFEPKKKRQTQKNLSRMWSDIITLLGRYLICILWYFQGVECIGLPKHKKNVKIVVMIFSVFIFHNT